MSTAAVLDGGAGVVAELIGVEVAVPEAVGIEGARDATLS